MSSYLSCGPVHSHSLKSSRAKTLVFPFIIIFIVVRSYLWLSKLAYPYQNWPTLEPSCSVGMDKPYSTPTLHGRSRALSIAIGTTVLNHSRCLRLSHVISHRWVCRSKRMLQLKLGINLRGSNCCIYISNFKNGHPEWRQTCVKISFLNFDVRDLDNI